MKKTFLLIFIFILCCDFILLFAIKYQPQTNINIIEVNDTIESLKEKWESLNQSNLPGLDYEFDYVILDNNNQLKLKTRNGLNEDLNSAIINRDTIIELKKDDLILGKLIIFNNTNDLIYQYKNHLILFTVIFTTMMGIYCILYTLRIHKIILKPFDRLKGFSTHIAKGNFDVPLFMDKGNHFGAFTESFDIMREELKKARENERRANQSKKELVASLSHDIKTPVASIKAVSELMQLKTDNDYIIKQLMIIDTKADQINTLITNMFSATLEELQELKVSVKEESSKVIYDLIRESDYNNMVTISNNVECLVIIDVLRFSQVMDNVISNSYKYANTSILVSFNINKEYLEIIFLDYGPGVLDNELPLIFNKFYRAKNVEGKDGAGLGLYISKYLMNKMQGDIKCKNTDEGFMVTVKLHLA